MKTTYNGYEVEGTPEEIKMFLTKREYNKIKYSPRVTRHHSKVTRKRMSRAMKKSWEKRKK